MILQKWRSSSDAHPALMKVDLWPAAIFRAKSLALTKLLLERGLKPG